jgi:hypothetical protein
MNNISNKTSDLQRKKRSRGEPIGEEINLRRHKRKCNQISNISNNDNQNNINNPSNNNFNFSTEKIDRIDRIENKNLMRSEKNRNNKKEKNKINRIKFHPKNTKFVKKFKTLLRERNKKLDKKFPFLSDDEFFEFLKNNINNSNIQIDPKFQSIKMIRESSISLLGAGVEALKSCIICFDEIDFETKHYLRCGHVFHKDCIKKWQAQESSDGTCPVCKQDIDSDHAEEDEDEEYSEISNDEEEENSLSEFSYDDSMHNNTLYYLNLFERNMHFTVWVSIIIIYIYTVLAIHLVRSIALKF